MRRALVAAARYLIRETKQMAIAFTWTVIAMVLALPVGLAIASALRASPPFQDELSPAPRVHGRAG